MALLDVLSFGNFDCSVDVVCRRVTLLLYVIEVAVSAASSLVKTLDSRINMIKGTAASACHMQMARY